MKVASTCSADDVSVKLCFLVNVRKASGLKVAGGRTIGNTLVLARTGAGLKGRMGCAGVAKAGLDDGIAFKGAGVKGCLKMGAAFRRGRDSSSDILQWLCFGKSVWK